MRWLGLLLALATPCAAAACYSTGDGMSPPPNQIYFPVGLAVSRGGNVLYVANSDFDLQFNGGTLQSYDLHLIRKHASMIIHDPGSLPYPDWLLRPSPDGGVDCSSSNQNPPVYKTDQSGRQPLGETCAPPVDSSKYVRDSVTIGAFATDLQLAVARPLCVEDAKAGAGARCDDVLPCASGFHCELTGGADRLFAPVRGDATLTWADLKADDDPSLPAIPAEDNSVAYAPFTIGCGARANNRCASDHQAGSNPDEPGNTRHITMPGEPFGMAQSPLGDAIVITHQTDTKTSLFSTGFTPNSTAAPASPNLQFVLDGVAGGGNGIAAVPHDAQAFASAGQLPNASFLQTSRSSTELDLLRYYPDGCSGCSGGGPSSSLPRPFLVKETAFALNASAGGTDSRGMVIDPSPRIQCKARVAPAGGARTQADVDRDIQTCARVPARVFFANRSPASMVLAEIGEASASGDGTYDPDQLVIYGETPLSVGPSRLYLAPIVDADGNYALRVFIVCFDSATLYIYDPEQGVLENVIRTATGPFAMAFDPFDFRAAALHEKVPADPREPALGLKKYRFAYIASFTNSYIQVIDLDNSRPTGGAPATFENIVFTLGQPTLPKGTK